MYQCNNLVVPGDFIKQLIQVAYSFIWHDKPDKVKRNTVIADYEHGGLKMLDIECFLEAQKVIWVKRLLKSEEGSWNVYPKYLLDKMLGKNSFQCNTDSNKQVEWMPPFYSQLFKTWGKTLLDPGDDPFKIRREVL